MSDITPPPPPAYPPGPPVPPPYAAAPQPGKGKAITALVLGIVSVALCLYWFIALPAGIVAIILGIQARRAGVGRSQATAGLITGSIGTALSLIIVVLGLLGGGLEGYCVDNPDSALCTTQ